MNAERYHLVDADRMHGPLSWDELRALLASGTVGADAQWCHEGETEFRPLSELVALVPPPPIISPPAVQPVQVFITVNQPAPPRRRGMLSRTASAIAAPVAVVVGLGVAALFVGILLLFMVAGPDPSAAAARPQPPGPKVKAAVLVVEDVVYVENAGTNSWTGAVVTLDPLGGRYQKRIAEFAPRQSGEFRMADFTRHNGERFPVAAKVPLMVMVEADGLEASVYRTR